MQFSNELMFPKFLEFHCSIPSVLRVEKTRHSSKSESSFLNLVPVQLDKGQYTIPMAKERIGIFKVQMKDTQRNRN